MASPLPAPRISQATAGIRPTAEQLRWQQWGTGAFFHVGVNTYADLEWSDGTVPPSVFDPFDLDTDQWLEAAQAFGARYALLTAKHHDGFCLWPTATTDYSVASSPWRSGRGDVVAHFAASCERAGLGFGIYLSPWDRNHPSYGDPTAYDEVYCRQLTELLTGYGEVAEIWFDGAGSAGRVYDWARIDEVCRRYQPQAMRFNEGDCTIRWVGNEDGLAADPVHYVTTGKALGNLETGADPEALRYLPPECDVSIRPGWFWHPEEEPKTLAHLETIHDSSVGLGAGLLLNLPPDRRGLIDARDMTRCRELGAAENRTWGHGIELVGDESSYELPRTDIGAIELIEDVSGGQRVVSHRLWVDDRLIASGYSIGIRRRHRIPALHGGRLRLDVDGIDSGAVRVIAHPDAN